VKGWAATGGANRGVYGTFDVFRPGGVMGHPNLLSTYIAMTVPLFIAMLFTDTSPPMKLVYAAASVAGAAALVLTLSRSGWIAFSTALAILMLLLYLHPILRGRRRRMKAALSTTLAIGLLIAAGPVLKRLLFSQSGALDFREMWVEVAWKMVKDHPLVGVGLNAFQLQQVSYVPYSVGKMMKLFGENWPIVHNTYMIVWAEQVTLGLLLLAALFIHLGVIAFAAARRLRDERMFLVACASACGLLAVAIDGLASFFIKVPASGRAFWIVAALLVASYQWARDRERAGALEQPIS